MSDPIIKGVKRSPSRPASRHTSTTSPAKNRALAAKSTARPKPLAKRSAADKAPARKATKSSATAAQKSKATKKTTKGAPSRKTPVAKTATANRSKPVSRKMALSKPQKKAAPAVSKVARTQSRTSKSLAARSKTSTPPVQPRQPTQDEAAALRAFERAHKEFVRGHFAEARNQFRTLVEKHAGASEVAARARTYLAIAEARLRTESSLPRDADSLYDRGVIELNRGEYVAAQEMFERALKREPDAAHIHYGLAATRARLGSIDLALESLQRALNIQPNLRVRAQHDQDLTALRNDPDFERLVFAPRF